MKTLFTRLALASAILFTAMAVTPGYGAVSPEEAAKLKTDLTPMGAEKAGNKAGTIPAWDGGYTKVPAGFKQGDPRVDPFASEKPVVSISAKNADQYADKLSDGVKAMMKKWPEFRIDVYPTHRTAALPQWAYENTFKNATQCKTTDGGLSIEGCYGGIPFPIPKDGNELMWNHLLSWKGQAHKMLSQVYVVPSDGKPTMASDLLDESQYPYWFEDGSLKTFNGDYWAAMVTTYGPPFKAGESFLFRDTVDGTKGRQAWQYLVGQRRTRKAPTLGYDTPDSVTSGVNYYDEAFVFMGGLDRYEWKIVGKKELYIPYNSNRSWLVKAADLIGPHFVNPDHMRWELHRVWIVDATLVSGKRHVITKRRLYLDEDTYNAVLCDSWDAQGQLWHTSFALPMVMPDLPGTIYQSWGLYNLIGNTYEFDGFPGEKDYQYKQVKPWPASYFTPDSLTANGTR
jgi:hypothetical protein